MKYIIYFLSLFFFKPCLAQKINNVSVVVLGDDVHISYDLIEESKADSAYIRVYSSQNYDTALVMVSGDVNKTIPAGKGKKIIWRAHEELNEFIGMIRVRIMCPPKPEIEKKEYDKGNIILLTWVGGGGITEKYRVEIIPPKEEASEVAVVENTGSYELHLPKKIKARKGYRIRLTNIISEQESATTQPFTILPTIPPFYKTIVAPIVGTGLVVGAWLIFRPKPDDKIPGPPDIPGDR